MQGIFDPLDIESGAIHEKVDQSDQQDDQVVPSPASPGQQGLLEVLEGYLEPLA